jgi:hypothetical protein
MMIINTGWIPKQRAVEQAVLAIVMTMRTLRVRRIHRMVRRDQDREENK